MALKELFFLQNIRACTCKYFDYTHISNSQTFSCVGQANVYAVILMLPSSLCLFIGLNTFPCLRQETSIWGHFRLKELYTEGDKLAENSVVSGLLWPCGPG